MFRVAAFALCLVLSGFAQASLIDPNSPEAKEINERIQKFYAAPFDDAHAKQSEELMAQPSPKYKVKTGKRVYPKPQMKQAPATDNPLAKLAGVKSTESYDKFMCKYFYKRFPNLRCDQGRPRPGRATAEDDDQVQDLMDGFLKSNEVVKSLDGIPTEGVSELPLWSDDYWRLQWGGTAYRYSQYQRQTNEDDKAWEKRQMKTYNQFLKSYTQPDELEALDLANLPAAGLKAAANTIVNWSPAEKYDLTVGDEKLSLTIEQRNSPVEDGLLNDKGNVADWMGICHGWSGASIFVPKAIKPVTVKGLHGVNVTWYPHDVRAMSSLAWANGEIETNQVGGRCDDKKPKTFKNGRLADQECFDTNPATLHLALGNMIGNLKHSMVMDKDYDAEVWNQPIKGYTFTYFNVMEPNKRSKNWKDVVVDYKKFKASGKDRFQKPLTRGLRKGKRWDDKGVKAIVGVIATVDYMVESDPVHGPTPADDGTEREHYTYDLELHQQNGKLVAKGGEWHTNNHPDFLWTPRANWIAYTDADKTRRTYEGDVNPGLADIAADASKKDGYPLCTVLKYLVNATSGTDSYKCKYERNN